MRLSGLDAATLFELSGELLGAVGFDGALLALNPAWERTLGVPAERLEGAFFLDLIHPDDVERVSLLLAGPMRVETPVVFDARMRRADGRASVVSWRMRTLPDLRAHHLAGRESSSQPAAADEGGARRLGELGLVAAVVAHDFNNVLTVIRGCAGLLRVPPGLTPAQTRELDDMEDAARHGARLVSQVLAYGRRKPAAAEPADLNKVIAEMGWMLRRLGRKVTVDMLLGRDLGRVRAEEVELSQVVLNLAINARDAMPEGGQLLLETGNARLEAPEGSLPAGDYVRLAVADTGAGLSPAAAARLYEPFFTTKKEGTGLGLFAVRGVVERCGGRVRALRRSEGGACFEVLLPRA